MAAVWEQRFATMVARALSLRESTSLEAIADLMPVFPVIDPADPDMRLIRGERRWGCWVPSAAVAAQNSFSFLVNPAGSNHLVIVERVYVSGSAVQRVQLGSTTSTPSDGNAYPPNAVDTRIGYQPCIAIPRGDYASAAVSGETAVMEVSTTGMLDNIGLVLAPGWKAWLRGMTVNTSLNTTWTWRERSLSDAKEAGA